MRIKLHAELIFIKGFALKLVLKQRHKRTLKLYFSNITIAINNY